MWKNYLKVAIRYTLKNKIYVLINVSGLGIAIAFGLTIFMLYAFNYEFDDYYKGTGNIIRINELKKDAGGILKRYDLAPIPMGPRVAAEVAGVENQTRYITWWDNVVYEDKVFNQSIAYVDPSFFDFFRIGLKSGSFSSLKDKSRIFLTSEMSWTTFLAMVAGLAMFRWIFDGFFSLWEFSFNVLDISGTSLVLGFIGFFLLVTVIAGLYPAIYSRRFQPAVIFRNRIKLKGSSLLSRILNSMQFAFALVVLIAGLTFMQNAEYLDSLDLGYHKDHVISIFADDHTEYQLMRDKIKSYPDIMEFAGTDDQLAGAWTDTYLLVDSGSVEIRSRRVGEGYMDLMGVKLIQGQMFNKSQESNFIEGVIVNQAYVDRFITGDPIGRLVNLKDGKRYVIGVIGNIIYNVYEGFKYIPEIYLPNKEEESNTLVVKTSAKNSKEVYDFLVKSWKEVIPYRPFSGSYQEDIAMGDAMETTRNLREIFFYLAVLGSLLSVTGIFALSSLNMASRYKEIGIRKVMGATSGRILIHINKDFILVLIVSILLGTGLGYFLTSTLLSFIYEYHTSVEFVTLILCGALVGFVAMITTSLTIISAVNTNPARILRDE